MLSVEIVSVTRLAGSDICAICRMQDENTVFSGAGFHPTDPAKAIESAIACTADGLGLLLREGRDSIQSQIVVGSSVKSVELLMNAMLKKLVKEDKVPEMIRGRLELPCDDSHQEALDDISKMLGIDSFDLGSSGWNQGLAFAYWYFLNQLATGEEQVE